jgi:hypothetical protein
VYRGVIQWVGYFYPRLTIRKHTYYIRVSVPKSLIHLVKKKTILYSLKTKEYREALFRVRAESHKVDLLDKIEENQTKIEKGIIEGLFSRCMTVFM